MTEIHRLVLAFEKREDRVEKRFDALRRPNGQAFNARHGLLHIRAGAVPLGDISIDVKRVPPVWFRPIEITADNGIKSPAMQFGVPIQRPMLRGIWRERESDYRNLRSFWFENGSLQLITFVGQSANAIPYASELVATFYSLLCAIDNLAAAVDYPGAQFGIEFEFGSYLTSQLVGLSAPLQGSPISIRSHGYPTPINAAGYVLPQYPYSPGDNAAKLVLTKRLWRDVWNALGAEPPQEIEKIEIVTVDQ